MWDSAYYIDIDEISGQRFLRLIEKDIPMQWCDGNFLLADWGRHNNIDNSSHVHKKKVYVSSLDMKFPSLEKSW